MPAPAAVAINDDLAASQAAIAVRAADDEIAGWIDVIFDVAADQLARQLGGNDALNDVIFDLCLRGFWRMLRADDDRVDPHGAVPLVFDGDLALAIRPQPIDLALLTNS